MKVLFIHCAYQYRGGEDTVVAEEMKLLQSAGAEVALLRFTNEGSVLRKIIQLPWNRAAYRQTVQKIKAYRPDVVHIHNLHFSASPSVVYAVSRSHVPFVCTLHNYRLLCPSAILFHNGEAFLDSIHRTFPWRAVWKGVYRNSILLTFWMAFSMQIHHWLGTWKLPNRFIVLSKHAEKIFEESKIRFRPGQLVVKPNFCSVPPLAPAVRTEGFIYVGRLSAEKGVPLLLNLFSTLPYPITLVGDGELKKEVTEAAARYPNITYAGSLQKQELMQLMRGASAMVFPSIWYEGMPLTIIESLACGTPVIATRLGAMEFMVTPGHDGLLFEAGNAADLGRALAEWVATPDTEKQHYFANARATYEKFYTPEENSRQLMAIYQSVIKQPRPATLALA